MYTLAPNETIKDYERKVFLMDKPDKTLEELKELQELTRKAISHLIIK